MQRKRLQQSKSKSQTRRLVSMLDMPDNDGMTMRTAQKIWNQHLHDTIADAPSVPQEPLSEPDPCPDDIPLIHIARENGPWYISNGHVHTAIDHVVANQNDPALVALYLIHKANGRIKVAWR